jgi:uncharacterized RDD family membrane protein YckC
MQRSRRIPVTVEQGLVTPEAVRLDFPQATVGSRGAALLIDWVLQALIGVVLVVGEIYGSAIAGVAEWVPVSIYLILSFLLLFGYPIGFETAWRGRTPGKALLGLRVVTVEGAPVRFRHAAIRAALGLVDFWLTFGLAAVLSSFLSKRNQRLGDFVAGTVVLRERVGTEPAIAQRFAVPPVAASFADGLDTSGLTHRDYATIRSYLLRVDGFAPHRREEIARHLLAAVTPRLGSVPTSDLPADVQLRAIAARYQQRSDQLGDIPLEH